jgi:hypothetical protein
MKKNWFATFGSADSERTAAVYDVQPDVAEAFIAGVQRDIADRQPRHAADFPDLIETITQATSVIQRMEELREKAIAAADRAGGPHADRKAIGIAAGMPRSRLYRILDKYGRPRDRKQASE